MSSPATIPNRGRGRRRPPPLRATVARTQPVGPHFVRVTLTGPDLQQFNFPGPASHFKLLLATDGGEPQLPVPGEDGMVSFEPDAPIVMRTYTARAFRSDPAELDIDMFVHGDGPASAWARTAAPGAPVAVTSSRASGFNPPGSAEWHLLAGDSSAIPAIATILSAQPDLGISAIVEVDDLLDAQALPTSARDGIQFVVREPEQISGAALLDALLGHRTPAGGGFVWIAAEALIIRQARLQLAGRFDRHSLVTRGYWRAGQVNHPDHDDGTENLA